MNRIFPLSLAVMLIVPSLSRAEMPVSLEQGLQTVREAISYDRYRFTVDARLRSKTLFQVQPARVEVEFEIQREPDRFGDRRICDVRYRVELGAYQDMPRYVLASRRYTPWNMQRAYAVRNGDAVQFIIEWETFIQPEAKGTAMGHAVSEKGGEFVGTEALVKLYPVCDATLSTCMLGKLTGIDYRRRGTGWIHGRYADFALESDEVFAITRVNGPLGAESTFLSSPLMGEGKGGGVRQEHAHE